MCTTHLTKEQATELVDTILNDLEGLRPQNEVEGILMAAIVQNLTKVRDGFVNAH